MILYFVGSLLTPQSFQSYSLEIVSYSLFSWFWGCFGLKELYHHQTVTVMKSDVMQTLSELVVVWKPGREFTSWLDANVAVVDFAYVTAEYLIFLLHSAIFFSLRSDRSVRSLLLITSTKHRAFIQFDCLSAGVWWRVSHQEEVEQQLPTNNDFHDWLICWWLSWLQLMVQSWSGQSKLLFCSSVRHTVCVTSW